METTEVHNLARQTEQGAKKEYKFKEIDKRDPVSQFLRGPLKLDGVKFWFVAWLIYGPLEKLIMPGIDGYLALSGSIVTWTPHIESLFTGFIAFPIFLGFYLWTGLGIPMMFNSLIDNKSFRDVSRYQAFLDRVSASYNRWIWTIVSFAIAVLVVIAMDRVVWGPDAVVPPWFGDRLYARYFSLVKIGLVAYSVAQVVIRIALAGLWLRRLANEMGESLLIYPYHVEGGGGLNEIGKVIAYFFYFVIIFMLWILLATILPGFLNTDVEAGMDLSVRLWSPLIILMWVMYLILVPILFFVLIWPTHRAMVKVRERRLEPILRELNQQLEVAEAQINGKEIELEKELKSIAELKQMYELVKNDYPTWPMSKETRRLFNITPILPTMYSLIPIVINVLL